MSKKVAVRGLAHLAAVVFGAWGGLVFLKGLWDCFGGQPDANFHSPEPWQFVTRVQWYRYAGFELAYGAACLALARVIRLFAARLPEWVPRDKEPEEIL